MTTAAGPDVVTVHDRMPVVLEPDDQEAWIVGKEEPPSALAHLLRPSPAGTLVAWPVARQVGDPHNDGPELINEVQPAGAGEGRPARADEDHQALLGNAEAKTLW